MTWEPLPVETDPDAVTARLLAGLANALNPTSDPAGWMAREGALEVALTEEFGRESAATNARAADAAAAAAAGVGIGLYGFPPILAVPAALPVTITLTTPGATVPAGLTVIGRTDDGVDVGFTLLEQLTAAPGASTVTGALTAIPSGAIGNGVPAGPLTVTTTTAAVDSVTATAPSADGIDAETRDAYLSRLVAFVAILRPGGVRASDLTVLARSVPGVARALAVDLHDATTGQDNVERTVSVFPVDEDGQPVGPAVAAALKAALEQVREVNFRIRVGSPTYTPVAVSVTGVADTGADPVTVQAAVHAAVLDYLSPARWGSTDADPGAWNATSLVRYLQVVSVIGSVPGVLYLTSVTLNGGGTDVTLPGVAALPKPATGPDPTTIQVSIT